MNTPDLVQLANITDSRVHLEQVALGRALLIEDDCSKLIDGGGASLFQEPLHRRIAHQIELVHKNGNRPTCLNVEPALRDDPLLQQVGSGYIAGVAAMFGEDRREIERIVAELKLDGSPFKFTMFRDIEQTPEKLWLVDDFIGISESSAWFGAPGTAKSAIAGDLSCHVAANIPWFGRSINGGAVLYLAAERVAVVKRRMAAWRIRRRIDHLPLAVLSGAFDFRTSPQHADQIVSEGKRLEDETGKSLRLCVVDTISRVLAGGDENSSRDMGGVIASLEYIREHSGAHVLSIHHIPQEGTKRLRGHGSLLGAMDTTVAVEKFAAYRTATVHKTNDGEENERVAFDLESVKLSTNEKTGKVTTAPIVVEVPEALTAKPSTSKTGKLAKGAQIALRALQKAIDECGQAAPPTHLLPHDVLGVSLNTWREYAYRIGISTSDEPNSKRKAFARATDHLNAAEAVRIEGDFVWIC